MARLFDDASSESLDIASALAADVPFAMACLCNSNDDTDIQALMEISDNTVSTSQYATLYLRGDIGGDPIEARLFSKVATTSSGFTANTWQHAAALFVSDTDRRAFLNGGSKGTNSEDRAFVSPNLTSIGKHETSAGESGHMSGLIAEAAIWDLSAWPGATDALKADGFERILPSLTKGYSPLFYPLGLIAYWPLVRGINDEVGGNNLTATGTSVSAHPRVIYPSKIWVPHKAAVVVGTILPQITNAHMEVST